MIMYAHVCVHVGTYIRFRVCFPSLRHWPAASLYHLFIFLRASQLCLSGKLSPRCVRCGLEGVLVWRRGEDFSSRRLPVIPSPPYHLYPLSPLPPPPSPPSPPHLLHHYLPSLKIHKIHKKLQIPPHRTSCPPPARCRPRSNPPPRRRPHPSTPT